MDLCWALCYDWMKGSQLVRGGGVGKSLNLAATCEWGGGRSLTPEETESWQNVCAERLRRACHAMTGEGLGRRLPKCGWIRWVD